MFNNILKPICLVLFSLKGAFADGAQFLTQKLFNNCYNSTAEINSTDCLRSQAETTAVLTITSCVILTGFLLACSRHNANGRLKAICTSNENTEEREFPTPESNLASSSKVPKSLR